MSWFVVNVLPWIMSSVTIVQMWSAGRKMRWCWAVSAGNQVLWTAWILTTETWGMLLLNVALWYLALRNHYLWSCLPPAEPTQDEVDRVLEYVRRRETSR